MRLPKTLYVKVDGDKGEQFLMASGDPLDLLEMGEKVRVGKYQLVELTDAETIPKFTKAR